MRLDKPLIIDDVDLYDYGPAEVRYDGPPAPAALVVRGSGHCVITDVDVTVRSPGVGAGVLVTNAAQPSPVGRISTANTFHNVRVLSSDTPPKYAFSVDYRPYGGLNSNNEFHQFIECSARAFTEAAYHVYGTQAHQIKFIGCSADGIDNNGKRGIWFEHGVYGDILDCNINRVGVCVELGGAQTRIKIDGLNSEHCERLVLSRSDGNSSVTTITNCRWDGKAGDKPIVDLWTQGPVDMRNNVFTSYTAKPPRVVVNCYQRAGKRMLGIANIEGNVFQVFGDPGDTPIVEAPVTWTSSRIDGNMLIPWLSGSAGVERFAKTRRIP